MTSSQVLVGNATHNVVLSSGNLVASHNVSAEGLSVVTAEFSSLEATWVTAGTVQASQLNANQANLATWLNVGNASNFVLAQNGALSTSHRVQTNQLSATEMLNVSNGNASVVIHNTGSLVATGLVQAANVTVNATLSSSRVLASQLMTVVSGTNSVQLENGQLSASALVRAPVVSASDRLVAPRHTVQASVDNAVLNVSDTRATSLTLMNTESGNVRANFVLSSTLAPVMRIVSTVTNARFEDQGAFDTNVANRGVISSATIGVLPNTELVFSTTNVQNATVSRGIRMVNAQVPESPVDTVFISPNGTVSASSLVTAATVSAQVLQANVARVNFVREGDAVLAASTTNGSANVARMQLVSVESGESSSNNFNANYQIEYSVRPLFSASAVVTNARFSETGALVNVGTVSAASMTFGENV
jgi:hypothetical protein